MRNVYMRYLALVGRRSTALLTFDPEAKPQQRYF